MTFLSKAALVSLASYCMLAFSFYAQAKDETWAGIKSELIGDVAIEENPSILSIAAPEKADDPAVVPVSVSISDTYKGEISQLFLIIDNNPSPLAAKIDFGPAAGLSGRRLFSTRVRMDTQSPVRAVMRTADGHYYMAAQTVVAAGGCSAPSPKDVDSASHEGETRIKVFAPAPGSTWLPEAQVMVRHPNFNGMQRNAETGQTIPARFIEKIKVDSSDRNVFEMTAGISISANPNLRFTFAASPSLNLAVDTVDTDGNHFIGNFPN
ncbi:MAG: quinoprotein dehydrogenase-associated SoxYZ-like carrier [Hyphomicrobiaceae bacterium]